ncbi:MAG: hypothetical protein QM765_16625 [Myxococcales bacterium]
MRVEVSSEGSAEGFAEQARRVAGRALAGNAVQVERVRVSAEPGEDGQVLCRFEVTGRRAWRVIVEECDRDERQALERAALRAALHVGHTLERVQRSTYRGPQPWPCTRAS